LENEQAHGGIPEALRSARPGKCERLAGLIRRYGKAIQYDLWEKGDDLASLWRQRKWAKLLNILDFLPRTSAYAQALATDPDLAAKLAQLPEGERKPQWRRSHRDYSPEVEMLTSLFDRTGELICAVAATRGARSKPPQPGPRPISAIERIRRQKAEERHRKLTARVIRPNAR
jgi:hypothetical protein